MSLVTDLTVRNLTPPGYFNLMESAPQKHKDYITWWNNTLNDRAVDTENLRKLVLTPWLYEFPDQPRNPWLNKLLSDYGFGFFGGTNDQAAALYRLISSAWRTSSIENFRLIVETLSLPPFNWFDVSYIPRVIAGAFVSAIADTGFVIYTTDPSPAAPPNVDYTPRTWLAPSGWTRSPSSAVKYARGYLVGDTITWCPVRDVEEDFTTPYFFSADVPLAVPSAGTLCIVNDDGSGDKRSVYYSDGTAWRKNSTPNMDLGLVVADQPRPIPEAIAVYAPNPLTVGYAITSEVPPPVTGPTQGYGTFATYSNTAIFSGTLEVVASLLDGGDTAISTLIAVLRRVKPATFLLTLKIEIDGVLETFEVSDMREAP